MPRLLVIIPTYNERENIGPLIDSINANVPKADILVVDDESPDGTGKLVDSLVKKNSSVHCLHRKTKEGLGRAYVAGFKWALERPYEFVVSMDADFSHDPKFLPAMLEKSDDKTVVIGSRYTPGGKIEGWGADRYLLSTVANLVTRTVLGLKPKDSSAGFKIYPRSFLEKLSLDQVLAAGYAFQVEMLLRAQEHHFKIKEVPITFTDRRVGESKISGEARRSMGVVLQLAWQREGLRQFIKFGLVGALNTVVDWGIYFLLNRYATLAKLVAKSCSFIFAAISSYVLNRRWTFRSTNPKVMREFLKFVAVATTGLGLNTLIFWFISMHLHLPDIIGLFTATALVTVWNFTINKYWTFKRHE